MLKNSFQHIPGIGETTEAQLWASGLLEWPQIQSEHTLKIPAKRLETIAAHTKTAIGHLENKNPAYFADLLPAKEHWRLFDEFRDSTAYVDIETTGLRSYGFEITTIALYDGKDIRYYVQGHNLEEFIEDIQNYKLLVTYNGKTFDVPFIQDQFGIQLNHAHIDLRYVLKSLGYSGGLKSCEKALGLDRGDLDGVDGYFAVFLWHEYRKNNNEKALETLLAYNIEDVVNLETLMVLAYNMKLKETPFSATHALPIPRIPEIPFKPDLETIDRIKTAMIGSYAG
nr:ribonuclease H-like domain-containing protein [uncultured Desulfobacter sp.]